LNEVKLGEQVLVVSSKRQDPNSIENFSKLSGALQREILVHIPSFLRRTIV
jgi:hypothetical protein